MHIPALIKVLLLFIASKSYAIAWTAPNSTAPKPRTKTELRRSIFETKVKYFAKTAIVNPNVPAADNVADSIHS